jgi:hypothetical protein
MGALGKVLKVAGLGLGGVVALAAGFVGYAKHWSDASFAEKVEVPDHDLPIPFPLSQEEVAALRAERARALAAPAVDGTLLASATDAPPADPLDGVDLDAIARERAIARGKHLVEARYVCVECHGADFGGGTMIDDPLIGRLLGPNLTTGQGSRTVDTRRRTGAARCATASARTGPSS